MTRSMTLSVTRSVWTRTAALSVLACLSTGGNIAHGRSDVQRDVEGYAISSCLTNQKDPYLKDQGDAWASVIVQRSHGDIEQLKPVASAVNTETAQGHVAVMRVESDPAHGKELPVLTCAEIIDAPRVREAIDKAVKKLAPAYRHKKK
jgi:hypothetical protein